MFPKIGFINTYGLMIAIGIILAFLVLQYGLKKLKYDDNFYNVLFYMLIGSIAVGFGSAALFQAFYEFIENPSAGFRFSGNITFLGGLIGGAVSFLSIYFIYYRKHKKQALSDLVKILPILAMSIVLAHGFGRIGCFLAGCCYGIETDSWLGVTFPNHTHAVYPTQLFEACFLFVLFGVLFLLFKLGKHKYNFEIYLSCYGVFRFLNEYLRGDDRGALVTGISPSQFWSIGLIIIGIALVITRLVIQKKNPQVETEIETDESINE